MTTTPATNQRVAGTQQSTGSQPSVVDANRDTADVLRNLAGSAYNIRRYALRMGAVQGQGYIGQALGIADVLAVARSEEHTSELQSLMRNSYAVFCLKKKINTKTNQSLTLKDQ